MSRTHRQDEKRITVRSVGRRALSCVMALAMAVSLGMGQPAVYAAEEMDTAVDTASQGLCVHHPEHTAECGYTEGVEGQPCNHVHDESCGYVEAQPEVPCDKGCTDTDGDGVIDHTPDCAYRPAVEGQSCNHVHDESCGYVETQPGTPCSYAENGCPYCITDWSWVDPEEMLVEMDGSWGMGMPGVSADTPLTRDELSTMLPAQINATADNGDTHTLDITWDLTAIPEEGATGGDYTITAALADDTYALTEDAAPLTVTLQLGASTSEDKTEDKSENNSEDAASDANIDASDDDISTFAALPSDTPKLSQYIIDGVSPNGTSIDLFDYWITSQTDPDANGSYGDWTGNIFQGINAGHSLIFSAKNGDRTDDWNRWTGSDDNTNNAVSPYPGIVQPTLGEDGYPALNNKSLTEREGYGSYRPSVPNESLAYLFDPDKDVGGKASYPDVQGLLRVDKDGYYYYDSTENYAVYYKNSNSFVLYKYPGVSSNGGGNNNFGQFFPFNAVTVDNLQYNPDAGKSCVSDTVSSSPELNHYFGMHMSTRFIQQNNGYTDSTKKTAVTYEFSGDDDVWIFIDGKLVADLGGIHNAASVRINFASGDVYINDFDGDGWKDNNEAGYKHYKLGTKMGLGGDTLPNNSYHTLDFFYLERGNTDSNMKLKYNLVTIPESSVIKVDQLGNEVPGAEFALYSASDYEANKDNLKAATPIATGTTNNDGEFVFLKTDAETGNELPITIEELYNAYNNVGLAEDSDLVLVETHTPDGYRSVGAIGLYFYQGVSDEIMLLSNSVWDQGAYAMPKVTATTDNQIELLNHSQGIEVVRHVTLVGEGAKENPVMFAVVFQKQSDGKTWLPVSGDPLKGWTVQKDATWNSILEAAKASPYQFQLASSGAYQVEISNLPGDIRTYYHICKDSENAQYTVVYYYTDAESLSAAADTNTYRIHSENANYPVNRVFSMDMYVTNIKNYLIVQKVDDVGKSVNNAQFALYEAADVTPNKDGTVTVKEGAQPYDTLTTAKLTDILNLDGGGIFPTKNKTLNNGEYYLVETSAPNGYKQNNKATHIIVNNTGVYADAGTDKDGISVLRGVGSVMRSMLQFAVEDNVDTTLNEIQAALVTSQDFGNLGQVDNADWSNSLKLKFSNERSMLDYSRSDGKEGTINNLTFATKSGWSKLLIRQYGYTEGSLKTNLGTQDITNLFSGTVTVRVTNDRTGNLKISKTVDGDTTAPADQEFTFTVTVTDKEGKPIAEPYKTVNTVDGSNNRNTITFDDQGTATFTLKNRESLTILHLPTGAKFTVEETNIPSGFTASVTGSASGKGTIDQQDSTKPAKITGTIGHDTSDTSATMLAYTNTYDGSASVVLNGTKTLLGRPIDNGETFTFTMAAGTDDATKNAIQAGNIELPASLAATVTGDGTNYTKDFTFGAIKFKEAGIYTFTITEKLPATVTSDNPISNGIVYDTHTTTATVTVTGTPGNFDTRVVYNNDGGGKETHKALFTNSHESLTLSKVVTGKQGDRDKPFQFEITVTNNGTPLEGTYEYIGGTVASVNNATKPNDGNIVFTNGEATVDLKHGQTVTLLGLPDGALCNITEPDAQADGYTVSMTVNGTTQTSVENVELPGDTTTQISFTNHRDGSVPTGIMIDSFPWMMAAGLCLLCGAALLLTWKIRRRNQMNHFHED